MADLVPIPNRQILQTGGRGLPAFLELEDGSCIAIEKATKAQIIEAAKVHELIARAHRDEAKMLRAYARGEVTLAPSDEA